MLKAKTSAVPARAVTLGLALLLLVAAFLALPVWREWKAHQLLANLRDYRSSRTSDQLLELLYNNRLRRKTGDEVLKELTHPAVRIRENYLAGRRVLVEVRPGCNLSYRRLVPYSSVTAVAGGEVLALSDTLGALSREAGTPLELTRGLRPDGKVSPVAEPGRYTCRLLVQYQLLPGLPAKWVWPSRQPFPWKLWPEKEYLLGEPQRGFPVYACEFDLPVSFSVVTAADFKRPELISTPEASVAMRRAFRLAPADLARYGPPLGSKRIADGLPISGGVSVWFQNLPMNFAMRARFQAVGGTMYGPSSSGWLGLAGKSGAITLGEMYDMFSSLLPGHYSGELILFTDEKLAYDRPGIASLWDGTLTFPVDFTILETAPSVKP